MIKTTLLIIFLPIAIYKLKAFTEKLIDISCRERSYLKFAEKLEHQWKKQKNLN